MLFLPASNLISKILQCQRWKVFYRRAQSLKPMKPKAVSKAHFMKSRPIIDLCLKLNGHADLFLFYLDIYCSAKRPWSRHAYKLISWWRLPSQISSAPHTHLFFSGTAQLSIYRHPVLAFSFSGSAQSHFRRHAHMKNSWNPTYQAPHFYSSLARETWQGIRASVNWHNSRPNPCTNNKSEFVSTTLSRSSSASSICLYTDNKYYN